VFLVFLGYRGDIQFRGGSKGREGHPFIGKKVDRDGEKENIDIWSILGRFWVLGAVYTCDFAYESAYDSVYDLLRKVSRKFIFYLFLLKCVDRPL
jgi:hypothetical protein